MRILVIGANGYVASRVIPELLWHGHEVIAGARSLAKLDAFWWRDQVAVHEIDVLERRSVQSTLKTGPDVVVYLVHGMAGDDFVDADRTAAVNVRDACAGSSVRRLVYLSGIIPDVPADQLSAHLASRREVEQILTESSFPVITLRAAMLIGAGSTSFELMRQLAGRLPVTVLPDWMDSLVEPLAITDLVAALAGAVAWTGDSRHFDIGGGTQISYPTLIENTLEALGEQRTAIHLPLLPEFVVSKLAGLISDIPATTVHALIESLREDMVAAEQDWLSELVPEGFTQVPLADAIARAIARPAVTKRPSERDPMAELPGDALSFPVSHD